MTFEDARVPEGAQICLMLRRYAKTFQRFLDGAAVRPRVEPISFEQSERGIVLLCERRSDIPGDHHFYIIVGIFTATAQSRYSGQKSSSR